MGSQGFVLEPIPAVCGRGQGTSWTSRQLIAGPSPMAEAAMQGANCTSGAIWGSLSCSRTLQHAAQLSPELGSEPATFRSLVNLLHLLSYSRPWIVTNHPKHLFFCITILQFSYWCITDILHADSDPSVIIIISPEQNIDRALLQNTYTAVGCNLKRHRCFLTVPKLIHWARHTVISTKSSDVDPTLEGADTWAVQGDCRGSSQDRNAAETYSAF